jgi:hypothetical protein
MGAIPVGLYEQKTFRRYHGEGKLRVLLNACRADMLVSKTLVFHSKKKTLVFYIRLDFS